MRKKIWKMLIILVILSAFSLQASASESVDKYIDEFAQLLPDGTTDPTDPDSLVASVSIDALLDELFAALSDRRGEIFSLFLLLLGISVLLAVAAMAPEGVRAVTECGAGVVCSAVLITRLMSVFEQTTESLISLGDFFRSAAPILAAISLAGGGTGTASVQTAGIGLAASFVGDLLCAALSGAAGFLMAMGLLASFGDTNATSVAASAKNVFMWIVGIATLLIMGTLSLQTVVASAADSAAMRSVKYAASGIIPIVGGTVSGALSTLASGLSYAKGVVGAGAIAVIVTSALAPLAVLLLYRLAFTTAARLSETFSSSRSSSVLRAFSTALDALIAVYSLSMLIYVFELILLIKSGVALLG